jgi:hypothetical protein
MQRCAVQDASELDPKRIYRVYTAMRLNLRRAAKRRLPKRDRVALYVPKLPDIVWSMDFMSDALACGRHSRSTRRSIRSAWYACSSNSNALTACRTSFAPSAKPALGAQRT